MNGCAGLFCNGADKVNEELLDAAGPSLRVVATTGVGFDHIDIDACRARGVRVGHTPNVLDKSVAELAVALTFAVKRRIFECAQSARDGEWGVWQPFQYCGTDVSGCTVGIVGLGRIGSTYATMMKHGFGCKILYTGPREKRETARAIGDDVEYVDLETLMKRSDVVSIHHPLTESSRNSIRFEHMQLMKPTAVLVNTGRGGVLDQDGLCELLRSKRIAGAGLDVMTPEPLPPTHELFSLPNCVILPHIGSATVQTRRVMLELTAKNVLAGLQGKPLPHAVC